MLLWIVAAAACGEGPDAPPPSEPEGAGEPGVQVDTALVRKHPGYARLAGAVERYREIAAEGGWPRVPEGDVVSVGDTTARVVPLRRRLALVGDLPEQAAPVRDSVYDAALAAAVARFQRRHGLAVDSVLGPNTLAALNIPVEQRIRQLERTLLRWHELPDSLGRRYLVVNIPEFTLRAFDHDAEVLQMPVIVGQEYGGQATPVFNDHLEYVIFNPYWNIPERIAREEILPEAREDRDYLDEQGYEIVSSYEPDAEVYDPYTTSLDRVESGELRLRQKPGPQNALGRVKFMLPNEHAIYLHGTPEDHLFEEPARAFSHGCIRVKNPADLAAFVLAEQPEWTRPRIEEAMHGDRWQRVDLDVQIPVYIVYWTAFVDDEGAVQFREDLYGRTG